ncbi:F-box-like/WD repeat-containing protein TBL1XR1-B isoform X1 [Dinothrombium tinctorium]|uniref:F-box-like/WD repeat-containing protein TBL1XR1-B isoform X1 n=1 Tax=Dinothrombium tinctorium TaxID=1965070 RepID=A0A443QBT9_9ACAR|nr:F-box-like/WD repeat-containing protein TBL1XR1-B isoform X1 [Dinothrombium tinctorium]
MTMHLSRAMILYGHLSSVSDCKWNPKYDILASGSRDTTVRILDFNKRSFDCNQHVLYHGKQTIDDEVLWNQGVSSIDWNSEGTHLVTSCCDSYVRIWDSEYKLAAKLSQHTGSVMVSKWNANGNYILSGGIDSTAIIWDVNSSKVMQKFEFHSARVIDVDWQTNTSFASCSSDKRIHVCELGCDQPIKTFRGHKEHVNAIRWDRNGRLIASGSGDNTLKIWSMPDEKCILDLTEHEGEVYAVEWSPPNGSASPNVNLLASGSFDGTVRLWDVERGESLHILSGQGASVYSIAFSPDGKYLASGSLDKYLRIWSTQTGRLIFSYEQTGEILGVHWNSCGDKVASCGNDGTIYIINLKKNTGV